MKNHTYSLPQSTCFELPCFFLRALTYLTNTQPASVVAGTKVMRRSRGRERVLWSTNTGNISAKLSWDRKKVEVAAGFRLTWPLGSTTA